MEQLKRYKAVLTGNVQGVGLRVFAKEQATNLGVTGWIKNMPDGTVDLEMQGKQPEIDKLTSIIKKGNFIIKVETMKVEEMAPVAGDEAFVIKY